MGRFILTTILLLAFAGAVQAATAASERRTALVIGNADYSLISPLKNPVNDARAMARVLSDLGFEVIAKENLNQKEMKRAIRDFGRKLGQGGVGLFYYSGHGLQVDGVNYLVPVQAPIQFEDDVDIEAVAVNAMLARMASAGNRLNIVILDSCRNNPYKRSFRSTSRGLAQMSAPTGTIVAYAAAPGGVALDGDGENGVYTGALLEAMQLPGLKIEEVFKRVRIAVREISDYQQVPWESSSLTGDFYFNLNVSVTVEAPQSTARQENLLWQSIEDSTDPAMFDAYLQKFPNGTFEGVARLKRDALIEAEQKETQIAVVVPPPEPSIRVEEMDATFVALKNSNIRTEPTTDSERIGVLTRDDPVAVTGKVTDRNWYRIEYEGAKAYIFGTLIKELDPGEITAWHAVANSADVEDHERFLAEFPKGHFAERARARIEQLSPAAPEPEEIDFDLAFWESIKDSTYPAGYEAYLQQFPEGHFVSLARARLTDTKEAQRIEREREVARELQRKEAAAAERRAAEPAFWNSIKESKNSADYQAYIKAYPRGRFVEIARVKMTTLAHSSREKIRVQSETSADATSIASTDLSTYAAVTPTPSPIPSTQAVQPAVGVYPKTYQPGDVFKDCDACPEMVVIPAGQFMMGSPSYEESRDEDEGPQHRVTIRKPFAVGKYEVMFREWDACVAGGGCNGYRPDDKGWGRGNRPVVNVSWNDAKAYLRWLKSKSGTAYWLLSEAEWEYAARAGTTTPFHFGSTISTDQANYDGRHTYGSGRTGVYRGKTMPVGSFPSNAFGLHDMHGNVWEWVEDCWNGSYAGAPGNGDAWTSGDCSQRVLRGGSWLRHPGYVRAANRIGVGTVNRHYHFGFRVARTLTWAEKVEEERQASEEVETVALTPPTISTTASDTTKSTLYNLSNKSVCAIAARSSGASTPISWDPNNTRYIDEAKRRGLSLDDCAKILGRKPSTYAAVTPDSGGDVTKKLSRDEAIENIKSKTTDQIYNYFERYYNSEIKYSLLKHYKAATVCINWAKSPPNYVKKSITGWSWDHRSLIMARGGAYKRCYNRKEKEKRDCECHYIYENDKKVLKIPTDFIQRSISQLEDRGQIEIDD